MEWSGGAGTVNLIIFNKCSKSRKNCIDIDENEGNWSGI